MGSVRRALGSPLRVALAVLAVVVVLLVVAQLVLPSIAESSLRDRLSRSGRVISVEVDAFPAITLLWHQADHVVIRMATYHSTTAHLSGQLSSLGDADRLDASVNVLTTGLLTVHDATLTKRGDQLTASARVTQADLRAAVPFLENVVPVASGGGQLTLRGTANVLGLHRQRRRHRAGARRPAARGARCAPSGPWPRSSCSQTRRSTFRGSVRRRRPGASQSPSTPG